MNLEEFLISASSELKDTPSIIRFMELRYDILNKLFPHKTFSIAQSSLNFFDNALAHLHGEPFDDSNNKPSIYEINYREWILKHKALIAAANYIEYIK